MSVVPLMRALMPVPEPPPVTCTVVPGDCFMYSSAQRCPSSTMVSEPLMVMVAASAESGASRPMKNRNFAFDRMWFLLWGF